MYCLPIKSYVIELFKEPIIASLKSKMAEIAILKIDMTSFFSAERGPILIKFRRLVQNDMSTAVMWSNSKPDVEFQYGGRLGEFNGMSSQSHLPHFLQGAATWWIHCHDSRATCHVAGYSDLAKSVSWSCHIAGCMNAIRHVENGFSPYFIFFVLIAVWALMSGGFCIVSDTLVIQLTICNKTITRFTADDKVVYQRVRREMRQASYNSWAWRRSKHMSWRSR